ncbi:putative NmrA-like domain-containing protein [Seiridium cardinale]|uniref:NmrA-like domain-containing protein n=1 Tax=Seiridium cardinale TaxID=138064 RepID=A0ABR2XAF1_9PEZI
MVFQPSEAHSVASSTKFALEQYMKDGKGVTCNDLFAQLAPEIKTKEIKSNGTSPHDDFVHVEWENVHEWDDFTEDNIDLLFGDELEKELANWTGADHFSFKKNSKKSFTVDYENEVNEIFRECLLDLIERSANFNGNNIRGRLSQKEVDFEIKYEGTQLRLPYKKGPDWPLFTQGCLSSKTFVVGESKRHHVFNPERLSDRDKYTNYHAETTMGQVGMYALRGQTRLYLISKTAKRTDMGAYYKVFYWDENPKMVAKSIWALTMLSMNDDDRVVVAKDKLEPIDKWWDRTNESCRQQHRDRLAELALPKKQDDMPDPSRDVGEGRDRPAELALPQKQDDMPDPLREVREGRVQKSSTEDHPLSLIMAKVFTWLSSRSGGDCKLSKYKLDLLEAQLKETRKLQARPPSHSQQPCRERQGFTDVHELPSLPGLQWIQTSYQEKSELVQLFRGINTVLCFLTVHTDNENETQKRIIDAAVEAGVKRYAPSEWSSWNTRVLEEYQPGEKGGRDPPVTYTAAVDIGKVVARAIEYEGEWPVVGGIRGNQLTMEKILQLGEAIRGQQFQVDWLKAEDLNAGILKTNRFTLAISQEAAIGLMVSIDRGAWTVTDEWNQLLPDLEFIKAEALLRKLWST